MLIEGVFLQFYSYFIILYYFWASRSGDDFADVIIYDTSIVDNEMAALQPFSYLKPQTVNIPKWKEMFSDSPVNAESWRKKGPPKIQNGRAVSPRKPRRRVRSRDGRAVECQ